MIRAVKKGLGKLENITAVYFEGDVRWASILAPRKNTNMNGEEVLEYSVEIEATKADLKKLKDLGISKRKQLVTKKDPNDPDNRITDVDENGKSYIRFTAGATYPDGNERALRVVDRNKNPIKDLVGNGSKAIVEVFLTPGVHRTKGPYTSVRLGDIQILEHVPYTPAERPRASDEVFLDGGGLTDIPF